MSMKRLCSGGPYEFGHQQEKLSWTRKVLGVLFSYSTKKIFLTFFAFEVVKKIAKTKKELRKKIDNAENSLVENNHVLRQMTGRRLNTMNPGEYRGVKNEDNPVTKDGHWKEVPYNEEVKEIEVEQLKVGALSLSVRF